MESKKEDEKLPKEAATYDSKETDELMTKELANRDDYGSAPNDMSQAYHDYLEDSQNFGGTWRRPTNQQELWNRFRDWYANTWKKRKVHEEKKRVGRDKDEHPPQRGEQYGNMGEGFWAYKNTPYVAPVQSPAFFEAMPAMKIGKLDTSGISLEELKAFFIKKMSEERIIMADEQPTPEEKAPLPSELPGLPEGTPKSEEKTPAFETEPEKKMDAVTFWNGIDAQTSATVTAPIDAPANVLETSDFTGKLVFKEFPDSGHSFYGQAKRIDAEGTGPNVALVLPVSGIIAAIATVIKTYVSRGEKQGNIIRLAEESMPTIFGHVFKAIKEKAPGLNWTGGEAKRHGGKSIPLVSYIYDSGLDKDLGVNLEASFEGMKGQINEQAKKYLAGGGGSGRVRKEKSPFVYNRLKIHEFVMDKIPEDRFKGSEFGMFAPMTMEEVEKLGGKEVADLIKATPTVGPNKWAEGGDVKDFWYRYNPKENTVIFENRRLTDRKTLKEIQNIWGRYGGGTPQDLFKAVAGDKEVSLGTVMYFFQRLVDKLTPSVKEKVENIFGFGKGKIEKQAYPNQPWAGPSLDQVGALVGDAQAKWASELAGVLAAKFDYISYPKLEGGPSDLKKLATLPLAPEQVARVDKYRELAAQLMNELTSKLFHNLSGDKPPKEEVDRLAEDILLNLVEGTPSSMSDEDFKRELNDSIRMLGNALQKHPHGTMPSTKVSPEDAMQGEEQGYDVVREAPEPEGAETESSLKVRAFNADDAVQVKPGAPTVDPRLYGHIGKVRGATVDLFMCPKHGPEPITRYLVELPDLKTTLWFVDPELLPAGSVN